MSAPHSTPNTQHALVPELGPALGRLTSLAGVPVGAPPAPRVEFTDLRLALIGRVFELASAARTALDGDGAAEIISPERLRHEWERAAIQASSRTVERIGSALTNAALRSGLPSRRVKRIALSIEEAALIKARLLGAGVPFVDGLATLDVAEAGSDEWREALLASARRLELCWMTLEQRGIEEEAAWSSEIARLDAWRPSPWPRRIIAAAVLLLMLYAGLVLGGLLPIPPGARGVAQWWWSNDR